MNASLLQPRILFPFILVTLIWGSTWLVITGQLGAVPPLWSISYRFLIAAAVLFAYAAFTGNSVAMGRGAHLLAVAVGVTQFCLNYSFVYLAEQHVTSGLVAVVFAMLLVPNSLFAWLFLKHPVGGRFLAGSAVAAVGVALLFVQELRASGAAAHDVLLGVAFSVVGLVSASIANVMQAAERVRAQPILAMVAWSMVYGVVLDSLLAWAIYGAPVFEFGFVYLGGLLYLALLGSSLAFVLYFAIIRDIGPGRAAYSSLLVPVVAMALSTFFEQYRWSWLAVLGGLLALAGLFIALRARRAEAAPADVAPEAAGA